MPPSQDVDAHHPFWRPGTPAAAGLKDHPEMIQAVPGTRRGTRGRTGGSAVHVPQPSALGRSAFEDAPAIPAAVSTSLAAQSRPPPSCGKDLWPALRTDPGPALGSFGGQVDVSPAQPLQPWQMGRCLVAAAVYPRALRHSLQDTADSCGQAGERDEAATPPPAQVPAGPGRKHCSTLLS
ncbi:hypothetical protein J1605_006132 [Eschrichtius robustus]|uniref:Uncharacterized protein n=1 Tax=Eschrichtius robustus TaxID=9764 RepID=A0AB34H5G4_ESCRO|nr:hypothetical protein J1605_006132 [Eschrichtius robustus]